MSLPTEASERKDIPIFRGVLMYFPDAIAAVAALSQAGNEQHNPGSELHWDRSKSGDEHDALVRHLMEAGELDTDGQRHSAKVAWRALAALQKEIEAERAGDALAPDLAEGRPLIDQPGVYRDRGANEVNTLGPLPEDGPVIDGPGVYRDREGNEVTITGLVSPDDRGCMAGLWWHGVSDELGEDMWREDGSYHGTGVDYPRDIVSKRPPVIAKIERPFQEKLDALGGLLRGGSFSSVDARTL